MSEDPDVAESLARIADEIERANQRKKLQQDLEFANLAIRRYTNSLTIIATGGDIDDQTLEQIREQAQDAFQQRYDIIEKLKAL